MLIKMIDGGLIDIEQENIVIHGSCPTCDYGSYASNYFKFIFTNVIVELNIKREDEQEFALSDSDMMKIILLNIDIIKNLKECQFNDFIQSKIKEYLSKKNTSIYYEIIDMKKEA